MTVHRTLSAVAILSFVTVLPACSDNRAAGREAQQSVTMDEIRAVYEQTRLTHQEPFRMPVRQQRERAMRLLAEKTGQMLAETEYWGQPARLTGVNAPPAAPAANQQDVERFRSALKNLQAAAANRNQGRIVAEYQHVDGSYRELLASTR